MTTSCHGIKKELLESALDCESSWVFIPVFIQIYSAKFVPFESGCIWNNESTESKLILLKVT